MFEDLAVKYGFHDRRGYTVQWSEFDNAANRQDADRRAPRPWTCRAPAPQYLAADIQRGGSAENRHGVSARRHGGGHRSHMVARTVRFLAVAVLCGSAAGADGLHVHRTDHLDFRADRMGDDARRAEHHRPRLDAARRGAGAHQRPDTHDAAQLDRGERAPPGHVVPVRSGHRRPARRRQLGADLARAGDTADLLRDRRLRQRQQRATRHRRR